MPNANLLSTSSSALWDEDCSFEDGCSICLEPFSSIDPPAVTTCKDGYHFQCILECEPPQNIPKISSMLESATFFESTRSKISSTSIKYKESISKSTRGLKEKLIARNEFVKDLRNGIQREMSTSIVGLARMIERLNFKSKQAGASAVEPQNQHMFLRNNIYPDGNAHFKSSDPSPYNANGI